MKLRMKLDAVTPKTQRATPEYVVIPSSVAGQACSAAPATPPEGDATQHGAQGALHGRTRSARGALQRAIARTAEAVAQRGRKSDKPDSLAYEWKEGERDPAFADRHVYLERDTCRPGVFPLTSTPSEATAASKLCGASRSHQRINDLRSGGKISTFNSLHPEQPLTLQDMGAAQTKKIASHLGLPPGAGQKGIADVLNRTMDAWRCLGFGVAIEGGSPHGLPNTREYRSFTRMDKFQLGLDEDAVNILLDAQEDRTVEVVVNETTQPPALGLLFLGLSSPDDLKNVMENAVGGKGRLTESLDEIADIFAQVEKSGKGRINLISGHSMGGASAQYVAARMATTEAHPQAPPPPMVLLDPQLLNNRHAAWAVRSAENSYQFDRPRGVAITLNSPTHPKKNLMGLMKSYAGYHYPGLLELKMPTLPGDAVMELVPEVDKKDRPVLNKYHENVEHPVYGDPRPTMGLGYHMDPNRGLSIYEAAIHRFVGTAAVVAEP
jgi:hypothetical protein